MNYDYISFFSTELKNSTIASKISFDAYLQVDFSGRTINVYNPLTVQSNGATVTSWQPGFRDLLCGQITKVVTSVEFCAEQTLVIRYEDSSFLSVSLRRSDYTSGEAFETFGFKDGASFEA